MVGNRWDRIEKETPKAFAAFCRYRDLLPIDRSVRAAVEAFRKQGGKTTERNWETWASKYDWRNRAVEHDSDLASRRREHMARQLERAQDDGLMLVRADLAKVAERIRGLDAEDIVAGQIPAALKTLIELELKLLGHEDRIALKHEGKIEVDLSADAAWVENYVRQLQERSVDDGKPEG